MLSIAVLRNQHLQIETLCYCNFSTITEKHWQNVILHVEPFRDCKIQDTKKLKIVNLYSENLALMFRARRS